MKYKKNYIGLAITPHDPAIAIINSEGKLMFAEGAERYLQNKRAWGYPPDDLMRVSKLIKKYCDPGADLVISTSWKRSHLRLLRFIMFGPLNQALREYLGKTLKGYLGANKFSLFKAAVAYMNPKVGINTEHGYLKCFPNQKVKYKSYNHHLTHAAAACYSSPFNEALCAIIDGQGEKTNASFYYLKNGEISKIPKVKASDASLGEFYSLICIACGFDPLKGEEWKVMGLAPYGRLDEEYYKILRPFMKVDGLSVRLNKKTYPKIISWLNEIKRTQETPAIEYAKLAFTGQYIFNEILNEILNNLSLYASTKNLVFSGGCALNSSYVGIITQNTPFEHSYVFCAPADDGNAVGAAWLAYYEDHPIAAARADICSPYLGTALSLTGLDRLKKYSTLEKITYEDSSLEKIVAEQLAAGKIVGWMQGRAEFGPRALGNRSILADPRDSNVKKRINDTIKFREEFRPFAPSILHEFGEQYFENYQYTPYMERTLKFRPEMISKVLGVVHVDGTGRLQSVNRELNSNYYDLIKEFNKITGIPILLNTSFNVMGKPIIHTAEDAVATFLMSGIDILVIGDQVFSKNF